MPQQFSARISFDVVYRAKDDEPVTRARAERLAETMLAVLRGSPKIKVVDIVCTGVDDVDEA